MHVGSAVREKRLLAVVSEPLARVHFERERVREPVGLFRVASIEVDPEDLGTAEIV